MSVSRKLDAELVKRMMEAVAAAKHEVLQKSALDALMNTKPEDLIGPDEDPEVIKGNARRSGCWVHSPAMVDLFAAADKRLTRVAAWADIKVKRVERVHARLVPGTKLVVLKGARADDLSALPVNRNGTTVTINLITLLSENGLTIETGYRERFEIAYIPKESPLWPGLFFDLGDAKERRKASAKKAAAQTDAKQENATEASTEFDTETDTGTGE